MTDQWFGHMFNTNHSLDNDVVTSSFNEADSRHGNKQYQQQLEQHSENSTGSSNTSPEELYAVVTILSLFFVVGSAGNAIVLWVFCRRRDQLVSTVFIVVLAAVDFTTCLIAVPLTIVFELVEFRVGSDILCKLYQFLITSNIPYSALIMVAIAVDRYLCICHPFVRALTVKRAWITSAILGLCASAIGICVALMYSVDGESRVEPAASEQHQESQENHVTMMTATVVAVYNTTAIGSSSSAPSLVRALCKGQSHDVIKAIAAGSGPVDCRNFSSIDVVDKDTTLVDSNQHPGPFSYNDDTEGFCHPTDLTFSADFLWYFQKFYNGLFLACVIVVVILYALIYRSVVERRTRRQRQKSNSLAVVTASALRAADGQPLELLRATGSPRPFVDNDAASTAPAEQRKRYLSVVDDVKPEAVATVSRMPRLSLDDGKSFATIAPQQTFLDVPTLNDGDKEATRRRRSRRRSTMIALPPSLRGERTRQRIASMKTAAMLFVVTVVFVATFLPAFLMTVHLVRYQMIIFYMYFANNVANPFIYSFMNQNFREQLQRLFCHQWRRASLK